MIATIYDYKNNPRTIRYTKPIAEIDVTIITGDEIVEFTYSDGTTEEFDACAGRRYWNFYDGGYTLSDQSLIHEWLSYVPSRTVKEGSGIATYERENLFKNAKGVAKK